MASLLNVFLFGVALAALVPHFWPQIGFRARNFSAGPARLPDKVMQWARDDFLSWEGRGMNVMEMSHRDPGGAVQNMIADNVRQVRQILNVPDNYHILYMHGGAHGQFAAAPLNLLGEDRK